jgi:6-phosphogluconolactonase (cycloisomerase 2 family)
MIRSWIQSVAAIAIVTMLVFGVQPWSTAAATQAGAVYALSNAPTGNAVLVWQRAGDGTLTPSGSYPTGGLGTGAGLGSQGAITLSKNNRWLFAVDAGSNEITSFRVTDSGLRLVDHVASGGIFPISLTVNGDLLYVLNAGGTGNITGFRVDDGKLRAIPGSVRPLSGDATAPAQVAFSPGGDVLVVTEKGTNSIDVYKVRENGQASGPNVFPSSGATPFGFAFGKRDTLIVSEANGAPGSSAASSYHIDHAKLDLVTGSLSVQQGAACWVVVTQNGRYAYTANAASNSVSGLAIGRNGELTLLNADGRSGATGAGPTDMALSRGSDFLYVRTGRDSSISAFAVATDGSLLPITGIAGLPAGAAGLIAR